MAVHWRREGKGHADRLRLWINGLGALATGAALAVILAAKFTEGAWLTIIVIPAHAGAAQAGAPLLRHLDRQLLSGARQRIDLRDHAAPLVVIPLGRWDRISQKAVAYAVRLSPDVTALHCTDLEGPDAEEHETRIRGEWARYVEQPAARRGCPRRGCWSCPRPIAACSPRCCG